MASDQIDRNRCLVVRVRIAQRFDARRHRVRQRRSWSGPWLESAKPPRCTDMETVADGRDQKYFGLRERLPDQHASPPALPSRVDQTAVRTEPASPPARCL